MENQGATKYKILIVDDDEDIIELLEYNLQKAGYIVETANNGLDALKVGKAFAPDLILLDIMLPKLDGVEAGRQLREMPETKDAYLVFLTARLEEYSEVAAFEVGADDYIIKPIRPRALLSRIQAIFRRDKEKSAQPQTSLRIGNLFIDRTSYTVSLNDEPIPFPKKEFELLYFLAQNPDKVFSRDELLQTIWGEDVYILSRTVDVHVRKIREKIGEDYIKTIKGVGYKWFSV
ncbi:MAG: DNA-binding response regulator [Bacteroidetes bacterium]|nr:MAG: DNA-binding response regulator [Bacteroidota bacterium]